MKRFVFRLCSLGLLLLTGCSSVSQLSVEVITPAKYTFPRYVRNVVLLNNSMRQPANEGHTITSGKKSTKPMVLPLDSLAYHLVSSSTETLNKIGFFNRVTPIAETLRTEGYYWQLAQLPSQELQRIADQHDADMIISFERVPVESNLTVYNYGVGYLYKAEYELKIKPQLSIYFPREKRWDKPILLNDSMVWERYSERPSQAIDMLPTLEEINEEIYFRVTDSLIRQLVPAASNRTRYYYSNMDPNMKDAKQYVMNNKWQEAFWIWEYLLSKEKKAEKKAELLLNMALYYELNDNFAEAIKMVRLASDLIDHESAEKWFYSQEYLKELIEREESIHRLEKQMGATNR